MLLIKQLFHLSPPSPLLQSVRFRSKINIQKPQLPHHVKATFLELTKPMFPRKVKTPIEFCNKGNIYAKDGENPYQEIIAGEVFRWFQSSRLVAFYHMNPMSSDQKFKAFASFKKEKMHFQNFGRRTMELAVKGTAYEAALSLYVSRNFIVFSPEPEIKKLLKISKKFPEIILMAGIYEGKFLSKDELVSYSAIPNIQTAQADLVRTLDSLGGQLVQNLNIHQNTLMHNLDERIKQLGSS
ncbi:hypothetical protein PPYR_09147 [Photinus pyralis]|uniref:Large ribosomal subunit protein uL10m n=1 Tax=Photinus pyralis TaxID=7054 RepID=A0A1Y1LHH9_PHOPY|nr:39S ribosomal protein L10, mitochondrial-like [Photinus pyralis]XP_031342477.1 39S ribosomal protein L10, mitochondrial-like [Photinus pyralis]KAB0791825.1 hypothetical protein PPYR_03625 [Photinus pyralis]KAB0798154.1 hypothetical protein PPYR_09147 [Photinus pyralis]